MSAVPITYDMDLFRGVKHRYYDSDSSHYAGIKANGTTTSSVDYTLPAAPPAANDYVLACSTAGVMSWSGNNTPANPSASVGLSAVNGSATTYMRSDAAPALSQSITPTWTGVHYFNNLVWFNYVVTLFGTAYHDYAKAASHDFILTTTVIGEAASRLFIDAAGKISIGGGSSGVDTYLYRSAAGVLLTEGNLNVKSIARVGGTLSTDYTNRGNVGTGEDDLATYTLPASTLGANGDRLIIRAYFETANNANSKTIKAYFAGTQLYSDTRSDALLVSHWEIELIRDGTNSVRGYVKATFDASNEYVISLTLTPTLTASQIIKFTGTATVDNDIKQKAMNVTYYPAP